MWLSNAGSVPATMIRLPARCFGARVDMVRGLRAGLLALIGCCALAENSLSDGSQGPSVMRFGVVTHFDQGWPLALMDSVQQIGAAGIRDELNWSRIERRRGAYDFSDPRASFIDSLGAARPVTIAFIYPNDLYDGGATPYTDAGREALARFIVAALDRFPNITAIEIGNEFNSQDFVFGPIRDAPYEERPGYYVALLKAVYRAVKAQHPEVMVLGGAAHSIPVGYFRHLFALDALAHMDGIVIHPYTSQPEQVCEHIGILNAAMADERVPIFATEFGNAGGGDMGAADFLLKMTTALASCGVAAADWYALQEESYFPGMGLIEADGALRPAGRAFQLVQTLLRTGGNPRDVSPDAMTYAYRFGPNAMVLWGERRDVTLSPAVTAYDATGTDLPSGPVTLDPDRPIVLVGTVPLALGDTVVLGPQRLVADSYHQFGWTSRSGDAPSIEGPWSYHALDGVGTLQTLSTQEGGTVWSEAWHPYIGDDWRRPLFVTADAVNPVDFAGGADPARSYAVVERYTSPRRETVRIEGRWEVSDRSEDGITLRITADGTVIYDAHSRDEIVVELPGLALAEGSVIDFIVGPGRNARGGDATKRRIRLFSTDAP